MPLHPFAEGQAVPPSSGPTGPLSPWGVMAADNLAGRCDAVHAEICRQMVEDSSMMRQAIDPALEALLSMLAPAQYQQPQMTTGPVNTMAPRSGEFMQGSSVDSTPSSQTVDPRGMTIDPTSLQQQQPGQLPADAMESDTLAMWSSAPSGFA